MQKNNSPKTFKCKQCGNCCLNLNDAFQTSVSDEDIAMWKREGQFDILEWVDPIFLGEDHYIYDIWFKSHGVGYQTRINVVLRMYMKAHKQNQ